MPYKDPEAKKTYMKAWRKANREEVKSYNKAYREANREKRNANQRAYREANYDKCRAASRVWSTQLINAARIRIYKLTGLKRAEIPTELLEAQALIIQIRREIRNHEKLHRA